MRKTAADALAELREELVARVHGRLGEMTRAKVSRYRAEVLAHDADPVLAPEVAVVGRRDVLHFLEALARGTSLDADFLARHQEVGRRRARQGVPLHALIQTYEQGIRGAWRLLAEEMSSIHADQQTRSTLLATVGAHLVTLAAQVAEAVAQAYASGEPATSAKAGQPDGLVADLLSGSASEDDVLQRVKAAGVRLGEVNIVAVGSAATLNAERLDPNPTGSPAAVGLLKAALASVRFCDFETLVEQRAATVIAVFPLTPDSSYRVLQRHLASALASYQWDGDAPIVALGTLQRGVAGIARSYRNALLALEAAFPVDAPTVVSYVDSLPTLLLRDSPSLAVDLYAATVLGLERHDAEHESRLVPTLEALLAERGNLAGAARRLFVHRHTLSVWVRSIEAITGLDPLTREDLLLLSLGLKTRGQVGADPGSDASAGGWSGSRGSGQQPRVDLGARGGWVDRP